MFVAQVTNDEDRSRDSVSITAYEGRASTLYDEHENDTTATHIQDGGARPNMNGSADKDVKGRETPPPSPSAYEKLAQRNPKPTENLSITLGLPIILLFDTVVPCIIYYAWYDTHRSQWEDECRTYMPHAEQLAQ
jgi:hypothetical protein